jgi:hypothetical protein
MNVGMSRVHAGASASSALVRAVPQPLAVSRRAARVTAAPSSRVRAAAAPPAAAAVASALLGGGVGHHGPCIMRRPRAPRGLHRGAVRVRAFLTVRSHGAPAQRRASCAAHNSSNARASLRPQVEALVSWTGIAAAVTAVIVAIFTAAWKICSKLAQMASSLAEVKKDMTSSLAEVKKELAEVKSAQAELIVLVRGLSVTLAGVPRALSSIAAGVRQAAAGGPVTAAAAASAEEVQGWLKHVLSGQYTLALAHLDGAGLMLQTEASLLAAGVAPEHVAPLLACIGERKSAG